MKSLVMIGILFYSFFLEIKSMTTLAMLFIFPAIKMK